MVKLNIIPDDITKLTIKESFISGGGKLQSKTATPSQENQIIVPDNDFDGLNKVTINAITGELLQTLDADFIAENIKAGVDLFGILGTLAERLPFIEERTYIHPDDWVGASAEKGSTLAFLNTYLGGNDAPTNRIYLALIDNTNTTSNKGDYAFRGVWASGRTAASFSRGNGAIFVSNAQATSPYSIGKGSIIRVLTIDL